MLRSIFRVVLLFSSIGLLAMFPHVASALEELSPELMLFSELPVISAATLIEQKTLDVPAAINLVTAEDIRLRGYLTLKDIMQDLPGWADVSDANENIVAVRGAHTSSTNKILILVNGHRMNDLNLGRYNTDMFMGLDGVERVEFIRGAGSVLYGTGALTGVVNVVMKKGGKIGGLTLKPKFSLFESRNRHYEAQINWGQKIADWDASVSGAYVNSEGAEISQSETLDRAPSGQTPTPGKIYWNKYPNNWNVYFNLSNDSNVIDFRTEHTSRTVPRAPGTNSLIDYDTEVIKPNYDQDDVFINYKHIFTLDQRSKITMNPSFHNFDLSELTWIPTYGTNRRPPYGSRSGQVTQEQHWQFQTLYENQIDPTLNIIAGVDLLLSDFRSSWTISVSADGNTLMATPNRMNTSTWLLSSALAQAIWSPLANLQLTVSGRYDMFQDMAKPRFTPRAGVVYKPLEALAVKLIYGQSYLSPQWAHVKSSQLNNAFLANSDLTSETFEGIDAIIAYEKSNLSAELDFFHNKVNGLISASKIAGTNTQIYVNADQTTYKGVDMDTKYRLWKELKITAGYSLVNNAGSSSSKYVFENNIVGIPMHIGRLGFQITPLDRLDFMLWGRAYSEVNFTDTLTQETTLPAWGTLDITANYAWERWAFQLGSYNLTDQKYSVGSAEISHSLPRPGRSFTVSAAYSF